MDAILDAVLYGTVVVALGVYVDGPDKWLCAERLGKLIWAWIVICFSFSVVAILKRCFSGGGMGGSVGGSGGGGRTGSGGGGGTGSGGGGGTGNGGGGGTGNGGGGGTGSGGGGGGCDQPSTTIPPRTSPPNHPQNPQPPAPGAPQHPRQPPDPNPGPQGPVACPAPRPLPANVPVPPSPGPCPCIICGYLHLHGAPPQCSRNRRR